MVSDNFANKLMFIYFSLIKLNKKIKNENSNAIIYTVHIAELFPLIRFPSCAHIAQQINCNKAGLLLNIPKISLISSVPCGF